MLDRGGMKFTRQCLENSLATGTVVGLHFYLDQAVRIECCVSFFFDSVCQAVRADHDNGV